MVILLYMISLDISGQKPVEIGSPLIGVPEEPEDVLWHWKPADLTDSWRVYKTVLPNGSGGGILETCGTWSGREIWYFKVSPSEDVEPYWLSTDEVYTSDIDSIRYFLSSHLGSERMQDTIDAMGLPFEDTGMLLWPMGEMTEEAFIESVQGSWLDVLRKLPRLPWGSPVVRTANVCPDGPTWDDLLSQARQLIADHEQAAAEYGQTDP